MFVYLTYWYQISTQNSDAQSSGIREKKIVSKHTLMMLGTSQPFVTVVFGSKMHTA